MNRELARYRILWAAAVLAVVAVMLCGCNANKKNTAAARQYTAFITRYNIYYNGDTHYKETLEKMEDKYEDDFTRDLFMHPIEAKSDNKAPQPSGDFKRSIEKAQKAIQVRSIKKKPARKSGKNDPEYKAWLKRDEYNPFLHNAWMLMGRSQYYNGDFLGAAATFFYVSKHFTWLPNTVTEAKLWQARSYLGIGWLYEAEVIITRIKPDQLTNGELTELYNFCYADLCIRQKEYDKAVPYLQVAIKHASGQQKTRLRFLLGQVYTHLGEKDLAYQAYAKAGSSSSAPYRTKFNARIKQSEVYTGTNIEPEVKALRRMTRYDRNQDYLDQIYYAIGNLYLSRQDTTHAIENYELAVEKSKRSGIEKAVAQITLGGLYFDMHNYEKAQPCYAEAVPLLPDSYPQYALLKRRSDVLDELAVYSQNVNLQDSLLRLAAMPEEQRLAVIDKIIEELKKKEKEEAEAAAREEYLSQMQQEGNRLNDRNQRDFQINNDDSWYFYNTATRNSGKTEFQKRWGARKLEDDWRRRNKATFNTADFDSDEDEESGDSTDGTGQEETSEEDKAKQEAADRASDPHNREYYLQQIPSTPEEIANAHEIIQDGLFNMGLILKDKLEDFPAAESQWGRLLKDYPDNTYRLDVYYNMYLMYMRQGKTAEAEKYRKLILSDFADSPYGLALQNPNYIENLRHMDERQQQLYDQTYADYLENRNSRVHQAYQQMMDEYPLSKIMPKFMFLDALAYATEKKPDKFNAVLRELLERYPQTDITPIASAWLTGMARGRDLQTQEGGNLRGMIWDIRLTNDSTLTANDSIANFQINDEAPQLLVLTFPTDQVSANGLLYEVARFNFGSFVVKDFDLELMNFGRLGMLVIKGFDNFNELNHYRGVMASSPNFRLPPGVQPIAISQENFDKLLTEGRTFEEYFRFLQEQNYIDAQADIIPTTEIETLEEAEDREAAAGEEIDVTGEEIDISGEEIDTTGDVIDITDDIMDVPGDTKVSPPSDSENNRTPKQPKSPTQPQTPTQPKTPTMPTETKQLKGATPVTGTTPATVPTTTNEPVPTGSEDDPLLDDF